MNEDTLDRDRYLANLDETVGRAVAFFAKVEGDLFDGHQSAREVLSHLVFWHRAYCAVAEDLLQGTKPSLLKGTLVKLNEQATCEFQALSIPELAAYLADLQSSLAVILRRLPDWRVNFPFKSGCRQTDVAGRIIAIDDHIRHHLARQERAYERGEAWVKAYFP